MVVGIPMKAYENAANPTYTVAVTISGQTFTQTVAVGAGTAGLPFVANPGLRNVPIGQPLMLQGPDTGGTQTTWNFTMTKPSGSSASLDLIDKTTRFPLRAGYSLSASSGPDCDMAIGSAVPYGRTASRQRYGQNAPWESRLSSSDT